MTRLLDQSCAHLPADTPAPSAAEIAAAMAQLHADWSIDGDVLQRTFTFQNFHQTMAFVNAVAWIAHREDHHPDLAVSYKTCGIRYTTHSVGGLSLSDFICAAHIDALEQSENHG